MGVEHVCTFILKQIATIFHTHTDTYRGLYTTIAAKYITT